VGVTLSEADAEGARHIINNPDFECSPTQRCRCAVWTGCANCSPSGRKD